MRRNGNGASIYTQNCYWIRKFKLDAEYRTIGVFADIKAQDKAMVNFFTEDKVITERYGSE
jgi:malonate-semialdehyde dehydrogenase (acetylating) / methylmalonate-semialdehyde dehydrogenase